MGIRSFFGQEAEDQDNEDEHDDGWGALGQSLGMDLRRSQGDTAVLTGVLDGHRTLIQKYRGKVGIKVKFRSGIESFSIRDRSSNLKTNRVDIATGDHEFDLKFRLLLHKKRNPAEVLDYLTPQRRVTILTLGKAVSIREIEEDDLEVELETVPTSAELQQVLALCVTAAKYLDKQWAPQDAVDETPQDAVIDRQAS